MTDLAEIRAALAAAGPELLGVEDTTLPLLLLAGDGTGDVRPNARALIANAPAWLTALCDEVQSYRDGITWQTTCLECAGLWTKLRWQEERAERAEALLDTPFPCPRCDRGDLLLRHMVPEPGRTRGHAPCLSRTSREEDEADRANTAEAEAERLRGLVREAMPWLEAELAVCDSMERHLDDAAAGAEAGRLQALIGRMSEAIGWNPPTR